jgi:transcriptional regulator with XRE-family HTH domain
MVNIDEFIKRLEIVLDYYNLSASAFADKINVQRSSLSHLLSGRNKPSLDFIIKVIEVFPEVDLYWILNGKGSFPKTDKQMAVELSNPGKEIRNQKSSTTIENELDLFSTTPLHTKKAPVTLNGNTTTQQIERIVIFYTDGTFKNYQS